MPNKFHSGERDRPVKGNIRSFDPGGTGDYRSVDQSWDVTDSSERKMDKGPALSEIFEYAAHFLEDYQEKVK